MKMYFDPDVKWESLEALKTGLTRDVPRFNATKAREILIGAEVYSEARLLPFAMRPFDLQWCYYSPLRPLWREPRPDYWAEYKIGSPALVSRFKAAKYPEGAPLAFARQLCDYHMMPPNASVFPVLLQPSATREKNSLQSELLATKPETKANLSAMAREYISKLGIKAPDSDGETAALIWMHALAIGYSPTYLSENADGVRQDWPRIPLPENKQALLTSAELGKRIAALLDTEAAVKGGTSGEIRLELKSLAAPARVGGGSLKENDLELKVGWGHGGEGGAVMPGRGKILERDYTPAERAAIAAGAQAQGLSEEQAFAHMGATTCDVYLNDVAYWSNIPAKVWEYTIGGYQVMKKWLSYRESKLLRRALTKEEVREVRDMARRIAAILLLEPALNENYQAVKAHTYAWGK